jgi:atypical dual specificity phosphatase
MNNFSFVIPNEVAGMGYPESTDITDELLSMGFKSVVSVSENLPDSRIFTPFIHRHYPLPDFTRIPSKDIHQIVSFLQETPRPVVIHCQCGIGRTGVVLACMFIAMGDGPEQALEKVRKFRPGSIDDKDLEESVMDYYQFHNNLK